tara:strand:- start:5634 stop:6221 length:588 start_codon:yes stop_codon:yes gene_type:complete
MNYPKLILIGVFLFLISACSNDEPTRLTNIKGLIPDLAFELTDENNAAVTEKNYSGYTTAVFFGFTSCPEVCPTTMHQWAAILKKLGDSAALVKVLFISVDPERDTTDKLKKYTALFGPAFIGLRGEDAVIKAMTKRYRVTFGYGDKDTQGDYEVSHSSAVFVFDQYGKARLLATQSSAPDDLLHDLKNLLASSR